MVTLGVVWPRLRLPAAVALLLLIAGIMFPHRSVTPSGHLGPSLWDDTSPCLPTERYDVVVPPNDPVATSPLLRKARKISDNHSKAWFTEYQWLSDHELLFTQAEADTSHISFHLLDTRNGSFSPLSGVNRSLSSVPGWRYRQCRVSPDRQVLIEQDCDGTYTMRLDGSGVRRVQGDGRYDTVRWLGNSRLWLNSRDQETGCATLTIYGPHDGTPVRVLTNSPKNPLVSDATVTVAATESAIVSLNAPRHDEQAQETGTISILRRSLRSRRARSRDVTLTLPKPGRVIEGAFSPRCERVAFVVLTDRPDMTVWVCELNGDGMHEVGRIDGEFSEYGNSDTPGDFQWTPDGRALSFAYRDALYVVSVG